MSKVRQIGEISVPAQFNGPPSWGNGGYAAGLLEPLFDTPYVVRISAPIPLETGLAVVNAGDRIEVRHGEQTLITARARDVTLTPPAPPTLDAAEQAAANPTEFGAAATNTCFVCGRARTEGDGLQIQCGENGHAHTAATVWRPHMNFADADGSVRPEILWAALDCPGGFSLPPTQTNYLLGEMTTQIHTRPRAGDPIIIHSWRAWSDGRKHFAGSALCDADGTLIAQADTLWIELKPSQDEGLMQ